MSDIKKVNCLLLFSSKVLSKKPVGCKQLLEYTANDILAQELIVSKSF